MRELKPITLKKEKSTNTGLTLEEYHNMSIKEIAMYFNNMKVIKQFCRSLQPRSSQLFITLPNGADYVDTGISEAEDRKLRNTFLAYMRLPVTTESKNSEVIKRMIKFSNTKYSNISISFTSLRSYFSSID